MNLKPLAQDQAWDTLLSMRASLPQGLILIGPSGVGKRRSAKALFQLLNCSSQNALPESGATSLFGESDVKQVDSPLAPCGECASCRKIAQGRHSDFIELSPKGESIPVDDLREMKKSLFFPPLEAKQRFVLIDEAHKLNTSSANTLLKTLEEPPAHTRFFLITHERALLLPTIISRCQFVNFAPLHDETIKTLLSENGLEIPGDLISTCLKLMSGGMDRAQMLAHEKTLEFISTIKSALIKTRPSTWEDITHLADALSPSPQASGGGHSGQSSTSNEKSTDWKLELLLDILVLNGHSNALAARSNSESLCASMHAMDAVYLRKRLDRHANKKLIALAAAELTKL